jgi:hypothetical protein
MVGNFADYYPDSKDAPKHVLHNYDCITPEIQARIDKAKADGLARLTEDNDSAPVSLSALDDNTSEKISVKDKILKRGKKK